MTLASNFLRYARPLTALLIAFAILLARPEIGHGLPASGYEETTGIDYENARPDPAAVPISEEAAIRLAKGALPAVGNKNPDEIGLLYAQTGDYRPRIPAWKAAWDMLDKGTILLAEIDATTGDLLAYETRFLGNPLNEPNSGFPASITRDRAKAAAEAFVRKAVPSVRDFGLKELAFSQDEMYDFVYPLFGPARYSFRFGLTANGYEAFNVSLAVVLDMAGNVEAFSFTGDPGQPVAKRAAVQAAEAKRIWANGFRMMPLYLDAAAGYYDGSEDWRLVYVMDRTLWSIDAMSGTPAWSDVYGYSDIAARRYENIPPTDVSFVPRNVSLEQAVRAAATIANFPSDTEWSVQDEADDGQRRIWELGGIDPRHREGGYYSLTVDARTGQMLDYADYRRFIRDADERSSEPQIIKVADARKLAERWLAEHIPDFLSQYKFAVPFESAASELTLEYRRVHRGVPVAGRALFITLDGNGKMTRLMPSPQSPAVETLDALKPTLDAEQAKKRIVQRTKLLPYYLPNKGYPFTHDVIDLDQKRLDLLYLAAPANLYELYAPDRVDAVSGNVGLLSSGEVFTVGGPLPADVRSHPSKKALQALFDRGMLLTDSKGRLLPDAELSRGEFLRMMHKGMTFKGTPYIGREEPFFSDIGTKHPYFDDIVYFVERRWLTPNPKIALKPDNPLTREQMAVWLTRIIGYEKRARTLKSDPQVTRLRDAGQIKDKGAAALVMKLGLMKPADGAFKPGERVTRAEAAESLLKLAEIQSQLDKPLWTWGYGDEEYGY